MSPVAQTPQTNVLPRMGMSASQPNPTLASSKRKLEHVTPQLEQLSSAVHPKRQRFTLAPAACRHKTYWLLDGSVVLRIKDTMFKLHRSRLAQQSQYFATLFAERNDRGVLILDDGEEEIVELDELDGCPVYRLERVSVKDFTRLLDALDNAMYAALPPFMPTTALLTNRRVFLRHTARTS